MSEQTKIAWADSTINWWEGCTKVSPGCTNCYAAERDRRFHGEFVGQGHRKQLIAPHWGKGAPRRKSKSAVVQALAMNGRPWICDGCGASYTDKQFRNPDSTQAFCSCPNTCHRRRIFSLSLGDWLDDEVPIEWLAEMLDTIRQCEQVTWILCSNRWELFFERTHAVIKSIEESDAWRCDIRSPQEALRNWLADWQLLRQPPTNIIGLCSVEDQQRADDRIPHFLTVPLSCRGLSLEPLLGPVDLTLMKPRKDELEFLFFPLTGEYITDGMNEPMRLTTGAKIDWLICGGESGPSARPCNVEWIRSLIAQGRSAGVATFVKQLGAFPTAPQNVFWHGPTFEAGCPEYNLVKLRDKKGGDPSEWPEDLRIQEWPKGF